MFSQYCHNIEHIAAIFPIWKNFLADSDDETKQQKVKEAVKLAKQIEVPAAKADNRPPGG